MDIWRLARRAYPPLDGDGARRVGGRWTPKGKPAVYAAGTPSLALLEVLVHLDLPPELLPTDYALFRITVPDDLPRETVPATAITPSFDYVATGDAWLVSLKTAILDVPSVIVPHERNFIVNPLHPDAPRIQVADITPFSIDSRLMS